MRDEHREAPTERSCAGCGQLVDWEARFCSACGYPVDVGVPTPPGAPAAWEAPAAQQPYDDDGAPEHAEPAEPLALVSVVDPLIGCVVADRYRILDGVGRGAMGIVYLVEHLYIGKLMAMKLLRGDVAHRDEVAERFAREAWAASQLRHPSTVQVFDYGRSGDLTYLVMEYVEGEDLGRLLGRVGRMPFDRVARLAEQICGSLTEAHAAGIVHRDLKPTNLLITEDPDGGERAKVADFGLAQLRTGPDVRKLTSEGAIVGTPYFMSPEQIQHGKVDGRADVYALGAVMYRACIGEPPFVGPGSVVVLAQHLQQAPLVPSSVAPELPPAADRIILRCLEKDPAARYATVADLRLDLTQYLSSLARRVPEPRAPRPPRPRTGAALETATQRDIESFEKRRRRRRRLAKVLWTLVAIATVGALGALGFVVRDDVVKTVELFIASQKPAPVAAPDREHEPNDTAPDAMTVASGVHVRGYIGKRQSRTQGDVDFYRIVVPPSGTTRIDVDLTGIPNMNLVLQLSSDLGSGSLLTADAGGVGSGEHLSAALRGGGPYYLSVRERPVPGMMPTENVSDEYVLNVSLARDKAAQPAGSQ